MVPRVRIIKKWPQKNLESHIFQNHVTDQLNQIHNKKKTTNNKNKKKTTKETTTNTGVHSEGDPWYSIKIYEKITNETKHASTTMVPKVKILEKWPQKNLDSHIFQNHVTDHLNHINKKKKPANNKKKKKTSKETTRNIGVHLDGNSLNQEESTTQVMENSQIENKPVHKKLSELHFVKLCLKSLSMDVLAF